MRHPRYQFTVRALMIAIAALAFAWAGIIGPMLRSYPIVRVVTTNFRGRWDVQWSDGTSTSYDRLEDRPALDLNVMGPLAWVKWSDGTYSLRYRYTRPSRNIVEPKMGVPSVGNVPPF